MRVVQLKLYDFNELSKEAQREAIERYRESYYFSSHEIEGLTDYFVDRLENFGYIDKEVFWSLSYSQGDGMRFEGKLEQNEILNLAKRLISEEDVKRLEYLVEQGWSIWGEIEGISYSCYHYNTMRLTLSCDIFDRDCDTSEQLVSLFDMLEDSMQRDIVNVSMELEREGYSYIDYTNSDEYIIEQLVMNQYEFHEDGALW